ncbi:hypothetical protein B0H13DRAFT_1660555 [Mycena leptocephala]|nr:hypothetical protein B0H13DRAFT_1660555 [Mycena leptocephala]
MSPPSDSDDFIRNQTKLPFGAPISLWFLPEEPSNKRPRPTIPTLVKLAIYGSENQMLTYSEICLAISLRFEWYRKRWHTESWRNSVRHALSLNQAFKRVGGIKGGYWKVDFADGDGYKRPTVRRAKNQVSSHSQLRGDPAYVTRRSRTTPETGENLQPFVTVFSTK